jgi:predicted Zn-dependent peptidase
MQYKKTTLPNGLRIITVPTPGNPAATVLVMVETGSNYEKKHENGLSHFLEHMVFKGTLDRPTSSIVHRELDGLGAQSNAFTGEEFTGYYAKAEKQHWKKCLDIISDMYLNPIFPEAEIEKERGVIIQEIGMYEDQPQAYVWNVVSKLLYGDTPAGRPIIGPRENIKKFSRNDFVKYRDAHYVAGKTVIVVAGDISLAEIKKEVLKVFKNIPIKKRVTKEKTKDIQKAPALLVHQKETDQMHIILTFRSFSSKDKRGPASSLLAAILGGGFSSRLFEKLRDEMGVCYYVRASSDRSTDHGSFSISAGIDPLRLEEVVKTIIEECKKLTEELVTGVDLKRTKDFVAGNLYLSLETTDSLAEFFVAQEILKGEIITPKELEKSVRAVTAKDIQKVAKEIFKNEKMNLAIVGKVGDEKALKKTLTF